MPVTWVGIHRPAAAAWVRTEQDARRYIESSAHEIFVPAIPGQRPLRALASVPPVARAEMVNVWLGRYRENGWLPYTTKDCEEAMRHAEQEARRMGGLPVLGVK